MRKKRENQEKQKVKTDFRKSAGIIVFRNKNGSSGSREYLLLEYGEGAHWDFPKGGIEKGESETQAATRELKEETGLTQAEFVEGFKESLHYFFRENGRLVSKTVVFFLAEVPFDSKVKLSFEHSRFEWLPFDDAIARATFKNAKEMLAKAEEFLKKNS